MAKKMTPKQLSKWLQSLPDTLDVWANATSNLEWDNQHIAAVLKLHDTRMVAYKELLAALEKADKDLASMADAIAIQNFTEAYKLASHQLGFYSGMSSSLADAAGCMWEENGRNVNTETGLSVY